LLLIEEIGLRKSTPLWVRRVAHRSSDFMRPSTAEAPV
jgi:hypothetical protein